MEASVKSMLINGIEYVPAGSAPLIFSGDVRIVILQRGWVMVGRYRRDGDSCFLTQASVLRNFSTTRGLGEIVKDGPTKDTKLDPTNGEVEFHRLTEIAVIKCQESKWINHLK